MPAASRRHANRVRGGRGLETEIGLIRRRVLACLGATAAQALLGPKTTVRDTRGRFFESDLGADWITVTMHPASIVRAPDDETRSAERLAFVRDLKAIARKLREPAGRVRKRAG